jgi:hypothetical protein
MKGGWAGAKVASASEEPGCAVTKIRWGAPTPKGGGRAWPELPIGARSAPFRAHRAESFPHRGKFAPTCRVSTMQNQGPAHARPKAPRGKLSF